MKVLTKEMLDREMLSKYRKEGVCNNKIVCQCLISNKIVCQCLISNKIVCQCLIKAKDLIKIIFQWYLGWKQNMGLVLMLDLVEKLFSRINIRLLAFKMNANQMNKITLKC